MGNQLTRDYEFDEKPIGSGGPDFLWGIHNGVHRQTKQEVSIFICAVKDLESKYGKPNVAKVIQRFRNDSAILMRLKHPNILRVVQPLIESSKEIAIVTEPVVGSISNLLHGNYEGISGGKASVPNAYKNYSLHELEVKHGLCQIIDALAFCHKEAKLLHLNLIPQNIYASAMGASQQLSDQPISNSPSSTSSSQLSSEIAPSIGPWKLAGFHFSFYKPSSSSQGGSTIPQAPYENELITFSNKTKDVRGIFTPDIDYCAPEYIISSKPDTQSDIFSIGCLLYNLFSHDLKGYVIDCRQNLDKYRNAIKYTQTIVLDQFPSDQTKTSMRLILHEDPNQRPTAQDLLTSDAFSLPIFGEEERALRFLSILKFQDAIKKAQFLRSFEVLLKKNTFPERILYQSILPALRIELRDANATLFALPCVLHICSIMNNPKQFGLLLPHLSKVFMYTQPPQIPLLLLANFDLLLKLTNPSQQKDFVIPFLIRCLENGSEDVLIESVKRAEQIFTSEKIAPHEFKQHILPRIRNLAIKTPHSIVRVNSAVCLGKSSSKLEPALILEHVMPVLEHIVMVDRSASCLMTVVGIYLKLVKQSNVIKTEEITRRILPTIIPMMSEKNLSHEQFLKLMKAIRMMMAQVEEERLKELNDLQNLGGNNASVATTTIAHIEEDAEEKQKKKFKESNPLTWNDAFSSNPTQLIGQQDDFALDRQQTNVPTNVDPVPKSKGNPVPAVAPKLPAAQPPNLDTLVARFENAPSTTTVAQQQQQQPIDGFSVFEQLNVHLQQIPVAEHRPAPHSTPLDSQDDQFMKLMKRYQEESAPSQPKESALTQSAVTTASDDHFDNLLDRFSKESSTPALFKKQSDLLTSFDSSKLQDNTFLAKPVNPQPPTVTATTQQVVNTPTAPAASQPSMDHFDSLLTRFESKQISASEKPFSPVKPSLYSNNSNLPSQPSAFAQQQPLDSLMNRYLSDDNSSASINKKPALDLLEEKPSSIFGNSNGTSNSPMYPSLDRSQKPGNDLFGELSPTLSKMINDAPKPTYASNDFFNNDPDISNVQKSSTSGAVTVDPLDFEAALSRMSSTQNKLAKHIKDDDFWK